MRNAFEMYILNAFLDICSHVHIDRRRSVKVRHSIVRELSNVVEFEYM